MHNVGEMYSQVVCKFSKRDSCDCQITGGPHARLTGRQSHPTKGIDVAGGNITTRVSTITLTVAETVLLYVHIKHIHTHTCIFI